MQIFENFDGCIAHIEIKIVKSNIIRQQNPHQISIVSILLITKFVKDSRNENIVIFFEIWLMKL